MTVEYSESSAERFVQSLHDKLATNSRVATSLANALQNIIETGFQGELKFLYELLQNADDEAAGTVQFLLQDNQLMVVHDGVKPFSRIDVDKICDFSQRQFQDKQKDQNKTGYKNIGFKSVFTVSNCVTIVSGDFSFRFDQGAFESTAEAAYPWPMIPIWTPLDKLPEMLRSACASSPSKTFVHLALKPESHLSDELEYFAENPSMLFFLRHVKQLLIVNGPRSYRLHCKRVDQENGIERFEISKNGQKHCQALVLTSTVEIDEATKQSLQDKSISDLVYPPRLRHSTETTLKFAVNIDDKGNLIRQKGQLFCFLPTQLHLKELPVMVNANFLLNPERSHLQQISQKNQWNAFLMRQIPLQLVRCMATLAQQDSPYRHQLLSLLPEAKIEQLTGALAQGYQEGIEAALKIPCLPTIHGTLTSISEAWYDLTTFYLQHSHFAEVSLVSPELMKESAVSTGVLVQYLKKPTSRIIDLEKWCERFPAHLKSNSDVAFQKVMLNAAISIVMQLNHGIIPYQLRPNFPVLCSDNVFRPSKDVCFSTDEVHHFTEVTHFNCAHPELATDENIAKFLSNLGVRRISANDIVKDFLFEALKNNTFPHLSDKMFVYAFKHGDVYDVLSKICVLFLSCNQHQTQNIAMWAYVMRNFDRVFDSYKEKLKDAVIMTEGKRFLPVNQTYLADIYQPKIPLQSAGSKTDRFISTEYMAVDKTLNWKKHLLQLGAREDFTVQTIKVPADQLQDLLGDIGPAFLTQKIPSKRTAAVKGVDIYYLPFIDLIQTLQYGKAIWISIAAHVEGRRYSHINDPIQFYLQNSPACLATDGKCYPAPQLLSTRLFQNISNNEVLTAQLPVVLTPNLEEYLGLRDQFTLDECLAQLSLLNIHQEYEPRAYQELLLHLAAILRQVGFDVASQKTKAWQGKLLAEDGSLQPVSSLIYFHLTHVTKKSSPYWLKHFSGLSESLHHEISKAFGMEVIDDQNVSVKPSKVYNDDVTKGRVSDPEALKLLAYVEANGDRAVMQRLSVEYQAKIDPLIFKVADALSLSKKGSNTRLQLIDFTVEDNLVIYSHAVNDFRTIKPLTKFLKERLNLQRSHSANVLKHLICLPLMDVISQLELPSQLIYGDKPPVKAHLQARLQSHDAVNLLLAEQARLHAELIQQSIHQTSEKSQDTQTNNLGKGYVVLKVDDNGECGFDAFGITRKDAHHLLSLHLREIARFLILPVSESLLIEEFYEYLKEKKHIETSITLLHLSENFEKYAADPKFQQAYIDFEIRDKVYRGGWAHPSILQALSHIQKVSLYIWRAADDQKLIPHYLPEFAKFVPQDSSRRVDLLFINNNHFDLLEFVGFKSTLPDDTDTDIYPLNFVRTPAVEKTVSVGSTLSQNDSVSLTFKQKPTDIHYGPDAAKQEGFSITNKKEISHWGQNYVYRLLKQRYAESDVFEHLEFSEKDLTYTLQMLDGSRSVAITWFNMTHAITEKNTLDIHVVEKNPQGTQHTWIEVKTTIHDTSQECHLSKQKLNTMRELGAQCRLFRVYNAGTKNVRHVEIQNPAKAIDSGEIDQVNKIILKI